MSGIELGYSYELGSGRTRIGVLTRPRWGLGMVMTDGTDPKKLCTFFIQCELNFQDRPKAFRTDRAKVTFAQSYLKGMALEWFEPDLLGMEDPTHIPWG